MNSRSFDRPAPVRGKTPAPCQAGAAAVRIAPAGDALEHQAERMAQALAGSGPPPADAGVRRSIPARAGWIADDRTRFAAGEGAATQAFGLQTLTGSTGEPLAAPLRQSMEAGFGRDFSQVRLHRGDAAARSAATLHANAYTSGSQIVLGATSRSLPAPGLRHLLAHELAHVVQQSRQPAQIQRQPTQMSAIPETERHAITVGTIVVSVPVERITAFFTLMQSGRPSESRSVGATNSFGAGIVAALQIGLGSIGAWIAGDTNGLPLNSSVEVDLDLSAHGGAATTYRFTYFAHATGSGTSATTANVMLIEAIGATLARPAAVTAPVGAFTIGSTSFTLAATWTDGDYTVLREALGLLPAAALTAGAGLTLRRASGSRGAEAGHYDSGTDAVELNDRAFPGATDLRLGQRPPAVRNVLHEVGHAIDLRVLERAWRAYNAAGQSAAARRTLLAVRSPSGSRWGQPAGSTNDEIQETAGDAAPAFRAAVRRDGVRRDTTGTNTTPEGTIATLSGGVTTYSNTDYQELYAESFAMYAAAPETLRQLRPATFAYFQSQFPRP